MRMLQKFGSNKKALKYNITKIGSLKNFFKLPIFLFKKLVFEVLKLS